MGFFVSLYRLSTGEKVGSLRLLLYVCLAFLLSSRFDYLIFIVDLLIVSGGILFASLMNDYYDHKLLGEDNAVGKLLVTGELSERQVFRLIWTPWLISLVLFIFLAILKANVTSLFLLWVSFILSWFYSQTPVRLKARPFWGLITPPIGIFLLFLQGMLITGIPFLGTFLFAILVFIYTWYLDFIHLVEDAVTENEITKLSARKSLRAAKFTTLIGVIVSVFMIFIVWISFISTIAWLLRYKTIRKIEPETVSALRKNVFSPIYTIEEFIIYAILFVLARFLWDLNDLAEMTNPITQMSFFEILT